MNFLAHIFLSCRDEELMIGNFMADFLNKSEANKIDARFHQGIALHRDIDYFTDQHELVKQGIRRLYPRHSKYAPVIIDIFYDYFLIQNWEQFSDKDFQSFRQETYQTLRKYFPLMPAKITNRVERWIAGDWLHSYGHQEGIAFTLDRMRSRLSRPELLDNSIESLLDFEEQMNQEFVQFFPEIINLADCHC